MKCPECANELENIDEVPFAKNCNVCNITWLIQTLEQCYQMGLLNTELLSRNDLSTNKKVNLILIFSIK